MSLRKFNNLLSVLVILLGLYISLSPFMPQFLYLFRDKSPAHIAPYTGQLAKSIGNDSPSVVPSNENRLVIPSIGLNEIIYEGNSINIIKNGGAWHRPQTVSPNEAGNSVIVGHRFYGSNTSTFYHLDKVSVGDKLAVYWEGEELLYQVAEVRIVEATAVEIEAPTSDKRLTLYTCHPLWTSKQRLVITAYPTIMDTENGENRI